MLRPFAWNHNNVGTCCVFETGQTFRPAMQTGATLLAKNPQQHTTMLGLVASVCTGLKGRKMLFYITSLNYPILFRWMRSLSSNQTIHKLQVQARHELITDNFVVSNFDLPKSKVFGCPTATRQNNSSSEAHK